MLTNADLFHLQIHASFEESAIGLHVEEACYSIAGQTILLKSLNKNMLDKLTAALAHAKLGASNNPHFTIHIWDSASLGVPNIKFNWHDEHSSYGLRGEVRLHNTDNVYTILDIHTGALMLLNKKTNQGYYWIDNANRLPWWVSGSPMQQLLSWWMRDRGLQLTHAGAVGYSSGGVILAGNSGAGKSTTALACMKYGMKFVSEDYCLLSVQDQLKAHCIYSSAKLEQNTLNFFPEMNEHIDNKNRTEHEKAFLYHHQIWPDRIAQGFPIKAILVLKRQNTTRSSIQPATKDDALKALAISTMWQLTHTGIPTFQLLKKATESVPCYFLHLGRDLQHIPEIIGHVL